MSQVIAPGPSAVLVTIAPADAAIPGGPVRSIWVGGTGNVQVMDMAGNIVIFSAVPAGTLLPIVVQQVRAGSTATLMVGLR